jgi:hypothetical protein
MKYPEIPTLESVAPSVGAEPFVERELSLEPEVNLDELKLSSDLYKEIALALSHILKSNNQKLLANLIDQSGKIVIGIASLCVIIAKQLNVPLDHVHIEYIQKDTGCLAKVSRIHEIQNIKINHIDYKWAYNEKYNLLGDEFSISLSKVIV